MLDNVTPNGTIVIGAMFPMVIVWGFMIYLHRRFALEPRSDFFSSGALRAITTTPNLVVPTNGYVNFDDARSPQREYDSDEETLNSDGEPETVYEKKGRMAFGRMRDRLGAMIQSDRDRVEEKRLLDMMAMGTLGVDAEVGGQTADQLLTSLTKFQQELHRADESEKIQQHNERIAALSANSAVVGAAISDPDVVPQWSENMSPSQQQRMRERNPFSDKHWQHQMGAGGPQFTAAYNQELLDRQQTAKVKSALKSATNTSSQNGTPNPLLEESTGLGAPLLGPIATRTQAAPPPMIAVREAEQQQYTPPAAMRRDESHVFNFYMESMNGESSYH